MAQAYSSRPEGAGTAGEPPVAFAVTEGASGQEADGLILGWYLIEVINTPTSTAVTIPGTGGAVAICRRLPCALSAATRRSSLREGAGTAGD